VVQRNRAVIGSRQIVTAQMGCRLWVSVDRECPQGGVLSPLLVENGYPARLSRKCLCTQGHADDLALLVNRKFPSTVSELMQRALNIIQSCCRAEELSANPDKTKLMLFTKRKKWMSL
jgi:hypothetical protein